jgi:hypothetical protein
VTELKHFLSPALKWFAVEVSGKVNLRGHFLVGAEEARLRLYPWLTWRRPLSLSSLP